MMRRTLIGVVVVIVILAIAYMALVHKPTLDPTGEAQTFDAALVATGAELVAFGDCASCHTAPGGEPFAGGLAVPTPFGTIYSTNITPDRDTGIGEWSEAAFHRAMREGVDRKGNFLYPAFPYDHFTHVTDEDNKAIYAYLMTRTPVSAQPPANELPFPYNVRQIMAGWNLMFLKQGPLADDPNQSAEWNRGRYLAEGLGHCGACHTPRNSLGAEDGGQHFSGGPVIDGWYVYPINDKSPAPVKWDVASLSSYLKHGFAENHGAARGPMTQVTAQLAAASDEDVKALATYIAAQMGVAEGGDAGSAPPAVTQASTTPKPPLTSGDSLAVPVVADASADAGGAIYAAACSSCHESGRIQPYGGLDFHNSTAVHADNPQNIINMILYGLPATDSRKAGIMPGFAGALDQDQMVALLGYLRSNFTDKPAWPDVAAQVADTLSGKTAVKTYSADGVERPPGAVNARTAP
jgi:mono/diheme cytochrome c family protein